MFVLKFYIVMQSNQHSRFQRISGTISNAKTKIKRIWNEESSGPEFRFKNINMLIHLFRLIFFWKIFQREWKLWLPLATLMWPCNDVEWWWWTKPIKTSDPRSNNGDKNGPLCHQHLKIVTNVSYRLHPSSTSKMPKRGFGRTRIQNEI